MEKDSSSTTEIPQPSLPKGGGAIRSIDEKFTVNAANGTAAFSIPFPFSPSRNGFIPEMSLGYNSGSGNGIFGLGWSAQPAAISRKTDHKLPSYHDGEEPDGVEGTDGQEPDIFIFSGAEDLVPVFNKDTDGNWIRDSSTGGGQTRTRYRPRLEAGFARIEKITEAGGNVYWTVTSGNNLVSVFGRSKTAQICDPADPARVFRWLLEFSYDDKGNCFQFGYKKEDKINVQPQLHEKNRLNGLAPCTNTYLKRIKYCNTVHFDRSMIPATGAAGGQDWDNFLGSMDYLLELVLDYGEHDAANPQPADDQGWICRTDPFSDYRAGFEIRTWRLCQRILMFHHFTELGARPCLVRSLDLGYDSGGAFSFLTAATQKGYIRQADGGYSVKAMPPVEFGYEQLGWDTTIRSLPSASLQNLPTGIDEGAYQWTDLYREGISGILTEQAGNLYYKRNDGEGNFEGIQMVSPKPSLSGIAAGSLRLQDLEANGQNFLVSQDLQGYYELSSDDQWLPFRNFTAIPNVDLHDPDLKLLDLDGDGRADILIAEEEVFTWYASKGKEGFGSYHTVHKPSDEEKGPGIVFADSTQSMLLADMSGDGLMDIVRIRNGEVVYWPNLGYGSFGARISMSNAPVFDQPDNFNPRYLKLADLEGSGVAGMIYLGKDSFKIYFNQGGNSWSEENIVGGINPLPFAKIDDHAAVTVIDLLGNGTGCIVWSSPLPQHADNPLRYIDLMGGRKPHMMTSYHNNMGKELNIQYKPSTFYYLADKRAGAPWVTKLPFPVQCVSEMEMKDQITRSRFTSQYAYHHGYYDFAEREFRGFGRVDQTDTEDFENYRKLSDPGGAVQLVDEGFHQPPVLTRTWFHTGAFLDKEKVFGQFAHEYYHNDALPEQELADPPLSTDLTTDEWREALRACKGIPLRIEVYTPDGSGQASVPYTTARHSCLIQFLQPRLQNQYAVFSVQQSESLSYTYERNPADPRIAHTMNIEVDEFGNLLKSATISYGRKTTDMTLLPSEQAEQSKTLILFSQNSVSNTIDTGADYHLPLPCEGLSYELTGLVPASGNYFSIGEIKAAFGQAATIAYQAQPTAGKIEKRLMERVCSLFVKNDLSGPLPLGVIESMAIPYQSFKLSLTPELRDFIFGDKVTDALLLSEGGYVHFNDDNYWIASGIQTLDAAHFYQVTGMADPFGFSTQIVYDSAYHYFVQQASDVLGNRNSVAGFNYRTLLPYLVQDSNDNCGGVRMDELGMVMSSFVMGKTTENKGDLMDPATVEASPNDQPSAVLEYDLFSYKNSGTPLVVKSSRRETDHFDSLATGRPVIWQYSYAYADGGGQILMNKVQAEPGIALQENADGTVTEVDTSPGLRWVGNGRTILNNKGKPVKRYEPYFSTTPDFEDARELVERGVAPVIRYDSAGRVVRTDLPDGTFTRVEFDAWMQRSFDQNDTVLESQWYADRIITPVAAIATPEETAAARKAAAHANTPAVAFLDSLGRSFLTIADNGIAGKYKTITTTDTEGNLRKITDARGNPVMQYKYDMLGAPLYSLGMDGGERWTINDVMGKPLRGFDSRNHVFRYEYDSLRRPVKIFVQDGDEAEINMEKIVYGEGMANDKVSNLRGKIYQHYDAAGLATNIVFDFKGNLLQSSRQLCGNYKNKTDWNAGPVLEETVYASSSVFDALNRLLSLTSPDQSILIPSYNEANLLSSVDVRLRGAAGETNFVKTIDYDAKGQRQGIVYGNNTSTRYQHEPRTFRLAQLITTGKNGADLLQKLSYVYDPVGNITSVKDEAQQTVFFNNTVVDPSCEYSYDAIYQLMNATGREHIGQNQPPSAHDEFRTNLPMPGDGAALRNYTQSYEYDAAGNILKMVHAAGAGSWTRTYAYEPGSNRLMNHTVNNTTENFTGDAHGNILNLATLQGLTWNVRDELQQAGLGGGGTAYYVYDSGGQRTRKVIERLDGTKEQRIYLGGFELYRKLSSAGIIQEETATLQVMDGPRPLAIVETNTIRDGVPLTGGAGQELIRYQYGNHLGSSCLELDENGAIISYEEYHPYGTTAYQAVNAAIRATAKRYRYTGMERDDETGLEYHSARYYLPWLGRWLNADPIGIKGGMNMFAYSGNTPCVSSDTSGKDFRLTVDQQNKRITIATTIHFLGSKAEQAEIEKEVAGAEKFYNQSADTTIKGEKWKVTLDVHYVFNEDKKDSIGKKYKTFADGVNPEAHKKQPNFKAPGKDKYPSLTNAEKKTLDFKEGDNIMFNLDLKNKNLGGLTAAVRADDYELGQIFGLTERASMVAMNSDSVYKDSGNIDKPLTHETGHLLGFSERYILILDDKDDKLKLLPIKGFEDDLMSNTDSKKISFNSDHFKEIAEVVLGTVDGKDVQDKPVFLQFDFTHSLMKPEVDADYSMTRDLALEKVIPHYQDRFFKPTLAKAQKIR